MKQYFYGILVFAFSIAIHAQDDPLGPQEILMTARLAGACDMLVSMSRFQEKARLENGSDLLTRFWSVEAARAGKTLPEYMAGCRLATKTFNAMLATVEDQ